MRKPLIAACFAFFVSLSSLFSQQLPKTLLWRISGNGLSKPSYIYGTMHVNDPRLFTLGDSLLNAISSSEGFANELDLNQITPMMMDMVKEEITKAESVKELVSEKTFKQYGPALSKKFNKPAGEITTVDILKEKNKWINDGFKGVKMQTFLDAYLTDLADKQGKWIGGIEDFSDQSGLLNSLVDESDIKQLVIGDGTGGESAMENMTKIYLNSDLDGFQHLLNGLDSNYRDLLLIRRNHKMAYRMDSLAHTRSTVFAVGAAHLPGEEGLIQLLKSRGFNVDPVFSSKKIKPEDYTVRGVVRPWVEVNDPDGHYKVMMPGTPGNIRLYGLLSMKMYYNIFNGTIYMTFSMPVPYIGWALDSVMKAMLIQTFGGPDYKKEKPLEINGISGWSYIQKNTSGYKKIYILNKDNIMYVATGISLSDKEASLKAVNEFFDSYQTVVTHPDLNAGDYRYFDSVQFYKVILPAKPNLMENLSSPDKSTKTNLMICADPQTGAYYFMGTNECRKGYVFRDDSATVHIAHENLMKKFADITRDTIYSKNNRRILEMDGSMLNGSMRAKTIIKVRGNRYYTLLIMYSPGKWNERMDKTLASFQLVQYPVRQWTNTNSPDSLFTTWAPAGFNYSDGKDSNEIMPFPHYECFDSNQVHFYIMRVDTLDNYFWKKNDSALWAFEKDKFFTSSDTLLSERMFFKEGVFQYEFSDRPRGGNNIMRMHLWLRGNLLYRMTTVQEPETISDENTNLFFDQFHFNRTSEKSHVFDSKAVLLLKDLQSADTLISRKANEALIGSSFDVTEIPLLQEALLVSYREDSSSMNFTNGEIARKIIQLNDSSSVDFARKHFAGATDEEEKNALLYLLSAWHTNSNYDSLGKLLMASVPKYAIHQWITKIWQDSLQNAARLFPTILPLLSDSLHAPVIFDLAEALLKDSLVSIDIFHPWQQAILQYAGQRFRKTKADTLSYKWEDYSVIYILQRMKTDSCNAMLKKWLGVEGNDYHKQDIVLSLMKNNQAVSPSVLQELAADENTRLGLYRNLKEYKKTALFPVKYLTQSFFAESLARDAAEGFSDQESDITFLSIKETKWQGKISRFFLYDLYLKDDNEHLLAIAGPFNINKTSISFSEAEGDVYAEEEYDAKNIDMQVKALLLQMSKK